MARRRLRHPTKKSATGKSIEARAAKLAAQVERLAETSTDWMEVFNGVFGPGAMFSRLFPTQEERLAFTSTPQRQRIFGLLHQLREQYGDRKAEDEGVTTASGSFLLRLPSALHAALVAEAKQQGVSLNQLCLAKLAVQLTEAVRSRAAS